MTNPLRRAWGVGPSGQNSKATKQPPARVGILVVPDWVRSVFPLHHPFTAHQRCPDISYTKAPTWLKAAPGNQNDKTSRFWDLARLSFPDARRQWLNSGQPIDQTPSPVLNVVEDPDQQMLCMDYLYYVGAITGVRSHHRACRVRPLI